MHTCHANFCNAPCAPKKLMCRKHWEMVPPGVQAAVYSAYRSGQCNDKRPSPEWFDAAYAAQAAVAKQGGKPTSKRQRAALEKLIDQVECY